MKKVIFLLSISVLATSFAGCSEVIKTVKLPSDLPALCTPTTIYDEFPSKYIYPDSVTVSSIAIGFEEENSGYGNDGIMGSFCAKATEEEIVAWYDKELSDYESSQMEDVGSMSYYYQKGQHMLMADIIQQDLDNGYKMFSLDVRTYHQ